MDTPAHIARVGHRGAAGYVSENTLRSFEKAVELGCDAVECDVRLTRDHIPVVIHDATVNRMTGGVGEIRRMTLAQLREFRIGEQIIPTLEEVCALAKDRMRVILELKEKHMVRPLLRVVQRCGMTQDVVFSSFAHEELVGLRLRDHTATIALLFSVLTRKFFRVPFIVGKAKVYGAREVHVDRRILSESLVRHAHDAHVRVTAWTANDPKEISRLKSLGVDGIISDYPDRI